MTKINDCLNETEVNVQAWTVRGPVAKPCYHCGKTSSYWVGKAVWMCVEHWEVYFNECKRVTPSAPTAFPSSSHVEGASSCVASKPDNH